MKVWQKMNIIVVETLAMFGRNIGNIICFSKFLYNKCVLHNIKGKLPARPFLVMQNNQSSLDCQGERYEHIFLIFIVHNQNVFIIQGDSEVSEGAKTT